LVVSVEGHYDFMTIYIFSNVTPSKSIILVLQVLNQVDSITQRVSNDLLTAQKMSMGSGTISVALDGGSKKVRTLVLTRPLHLPEIRRLRRQYVQWVGSHPPDDSSKAGIANSFLSYVETQL
jgi:hypothetical protein